MCKMYDARARLLFCKSKPVVFLEFSLPFSSPSSDFKVPIDRGQETTVTNVL